MPKITIWGLSVPILGFLQWFLYLIVYFVALIITVFITPFLPLFATKEAKLPVWLNWFMTPDEDLDGDAGWKSQHSLWLEKLPASMQTYWKRVFWLYRNPLYNFSISVLGVSKDPANPPVLIQGEGFDTKGTFKSRYWMVYFMRDNQTTKRRFKVYIGWKLKTDSFDKYQFAFLINPFQSI